VPAIAEPIDPDDVYVIDGDTQSASRVSGASKPTNLTP
jgi:hypothetical protein